MYGIIYKVTNIQNNKIYIGQTTRSLEERKYYHFYRADHELEITHTHFINAIRKYGKNSFQWEKEVKIEETHHGFPGFIVRIAPKNKEFQRNKWRKKRFL